MAKYDGLRDHLSPVAQSRVVLSFGEIAAVVPGGLPPCAYRHRMWWLNEPEGSHVQARGWLDAGWRVDEVDPTAKQVAFVRQLN
jgi:hypothetical protein